MKNVLVNLLKYGISLAIIVWLVNGIQTQDPEAFERMLREPKDWTLLTVAWLLCLLGVAIAIVRWYSLVRALDLRFSHRDAFRLGALGYLFNFVSVGSVGGDLFKAVFIAREQPGRRAQAVATVAVDRSIGLYGLLVVASLGVVANGVAWSAHLDRTIVDAGRLVLAVTAAGGAVAAAVLAPGLDRKRLTALLLRIPRAGHHVESLIEAVRMYRRQPRTLLLAGLLSLAVHVCFVLGFAAIAAGLPGQHPSLREQFAIVPVALVTGVLPLPMGGLGAFEYVMDFCYQNVSSVPVSVGFGLMVAFVYRAITVAIAIVGVFFYLASRREVAEVLHEAEKA